MKERLFHSRVKELLKQRNLLLTFAMGLLLSNGILGIIVGLSDQRVIVMPADLRSEVWVERGRVSESYVEEMAVFFCHLILTVSPQSAAFQRDILLRYALPESYGELRAKLTSEETRYKKEELSTSFRPSSLTINTLQNEVKISGDLTSYVGQKKVTQTRETYILQYRYEYAKMWIKSFKVEEKTT